MNRKCESDASADDLFKEFIVSQKYKNLVLCAYLRQYNIDYIFLYFQIWMHLVKSRRFYIGKSP